MKNQQKQSSSALANAAHLTRARRQDAHKSASISLTPEIVEGLRLIAVFNRPFEEKTLREQAARALVDLCDRNIELFEWVIEDARKYAKLAHICDFSPYVPNSFVVLANVRCTERVLSFLEEIVRNEYGIPRWEALETLCLLDHSDADRIIEKVLKGNYPPRLLDPKLDVRAIESAKGSKHKNRIKATMSLKRNAQKGRRVVP